ncbi:DUF58 domain-containing protein [Hymenobacter sp. CRA2]|uniref:DUF58 domain-containing protein n=1 Tax=Hymenobacter sp. CRA2 TaxID=1955620 RepID=UPI00098EB114|nr:DUF58 domain-containing protein [Hymenobacter sp. CRA2]OON69748.1 cell division protein FtsB [Hymenobacter sp. CRA2]
MPASPLREFFRAVLLPPRFFVALAAVLVLLTVAHFWRVLLVPAQVLAGLLALLTLLDALLVFRAAPGVFARRVLSKRLSNGDDNDVRIVVENRYPFAARLDVIDDVPVQFQRRDLVFPLHLPSGHSTTLQYQLRPTRRGEYVFGQTNVLARSPLGLVQRRYRFGEQDEVAAVYPSFLQMRRYELLALSNRLSEVGVKRIRRVGQSMEFDHIRPYALGDDPRAINWKATARRPGQGDQLLVNHHEDERAQQVYCIIDKGRVMRMPFAELALLDYAINASLVLSNIALLKHDRAGLITFAHEPGDVVPADRRRGQLPRLLEVLYRQQTRFLESDFERLAVLVQRQVKQRSLLVLFTNFESLHGLQRQLPYLRRLAARHLLLVVFFENSELRQVLETPASTTDELYVQTVADKFSQDKRRMVLELQRLGIHALLTTPQNLTVNTINRYLEFKSRGLI